MSGRMLKKSAGSVPDIREVEAYLVLPQMFNFQR